MPDDLEERLKALESAQERRHAELLNRLDADRPLTAADAAATLRRGYEQSGQERREAAERGDGE